MAACGFLVASLLLSCLAESCHGATFSSLQRTLVVNASPSPGQVLKAGEDQMTVTWSYNQTFAAGTDSTYKTIKLKLCYAPISQVDRSWRKTVDNLDKDKTCQFTVVSEPYSGSPTSNDNNSSSTWTVTKDIPTATYFVRAYAYNAGGVEAAYGQTTDAHKTTNLFQVEGITGRHVSLDVASICFSGFSIVTLFGFFYLERRKAKLSK